MTNRTMNSAVLAANNGLHSARALSTAHNILNNHDLCQAVLYQVVLTGSESIATYKATIKALVRRLRNYGCRVEYFGAFEHQPMKGMHAHCFLLIETSKKTPFRILDIKDGGYLHKLADRNGINRIHIAKPKNPMHGGQLFARPVGDKLEDCLSWATYVYKNRSKHGVKSRETYFNSEFKANTVKRAAELAAMVAPKAESVQQTEPLVQQEAAATTPTNDNEGEDRMNIDQLPPTAHAYLAGLYESFVDRGLDVGAIRAELAKAGIRRTPGQTEYDLEHRYGFIGYSARNPAPRQLTYAELDALEEAKVSKPARVLMRSSPPISTGAARLN